MKRVFFKNLIYNISLIIFYMFSYYYKLIKGKVDKLFAFEGKFTNVESKSFSLEMKSLIFSFIFAFIFYYFIVIELSILVFGYSLLCYGFLFLFVFIGLIISWRLEVLFLKRLLKANKGRFSSFETWLFYYDEKIPYSFYDYLTNYKNKLMFKHVVIDSNIDEFEKGGFIMKTYLFLFCIAFVYLCSYGFWPQYVNFVSNYFYPSVNFFEIGSEPKLNDLYSSLIGIGNGLTFNLEYLYDTDPLLYNLIGKIPKASPKWEARAESVWFNKTSLGIGSNYGDVFFLGSLGKNVALQPLIFDVEPPTEVCDRFDPNIPMFFLGFMGSQIDQPTNNFWKKNFIYDKHMWDFISNIKDNVDVKFEEMEEWAPLMYFDEDVVTPSPFDSLLSENYFDNKLNITRKNFFEYGGYGEVYDNLVDPNSKELMSDFNVLEHGFTGGLVYKSNQTYFGLRGHHKITNDVSETMTKKNQGWSRLVNLLKLYDFNKFNKSNLINFITIKTTDTPLYRYGDFASYLSLEQIDFEEFDLIDKKTFDTYVKNLNWRLIVLEEKYGLESQPFTPHDFAIINWSHLLMLTLGGVGRLDAFVTDHHYYGLLKNYFPTMYEVSNYFRFFSRPSGGMRKLYERFTKNSNGLELLEAPSAEMLTQLSQLEKIIRNFEETINLGKKYSNDYSTFITTNFLEKKFKPWYIGSLKYFDSGDIRTPFPGFVGFYYPTPYPTVFSTFGFTWFKYQMFNLKNNLKTNYITESISYTGDGSTSPTVLYTGVEAIMYIKPLVKIFDVLSNLIIWVFSYPLEFVTTGWPILFDHLSIIIFLVHVTWFLHFYIYLFLLFYFVYYFLKFYYYQSSYMWIYEKMFETGFSTQLNGLVYWHNLNDIWLNYRTPYQFSILSLQTSLFLFYSFNNLLKFNVITKYGFQNFLQYLSIFYSESYDIIKYFKYNDDKLLCYSNLLALDNFKYFKYFHKLNYKKYTFLLYDGGSDCNVENLVWNYYDYLIQYSNFVSKALLRNYYFRDDYFNSLIKQLTVAFSAQSLSTHFFFLSSPILDTALNKKLFIEFFRYIELNCFIDNKFFIKNLSLTKKVQNSIFVYAQLLNLRFNYFNNILNNLEDLYKILSSKNLIFLSKFESDNTWDSVEYWIFAFFGSFGFIKKTQYPFINFPLVHEINRLSLGRRAYSNSWIGTTINVRPFYNLIQHIWWTSRAYSPAFSITDNYINFNTIGLNGLDNVGNFFEKGYSYFSGKKQETIFGVVNTLEFVFGKKKYINLKKFNNPKLNYDLTYPRDSIENITTNGLYDKTNPPMNLLELNLTPYRIFNLFGKFYPKNIFLYLTFLEQIDFLDNKIINPTVRNIKKDYSRVEFVNTYVDIGDPKLVSKFDFYLKKFDKNLKLNKYDNLSNWMFSFDTSFFFSHFTSWDYFNFGQSDLILETKKSNFYYLIKNKSYSEMNSFYTTSNHWFSKPFGVLDKLELNLMQRYKDTKDLDVLSYTQNGEDPFLFLEKETFQSVSGLSSIGLEDEGTSLDSYREKYVGQGSNRYLFNNSYISNSPGPIILGWVGEIYSCSIDSTNMLFSILYSSSDPNPLAFKKKKRLFHFYDFFNYKKYFYPTYFDTSHQGQILYSRIFSWLNLVLYPTSYRNFFGIKSLSRLDYWSWKCGIHIDYKNGYYNYGPYLGLGHSFGTGLLSFDSNFGFYRSYRQIEDDPTIVDLETDALEKVFNEQKNPTDSDKNYETNSDYSYDLNDSDDGGILGSLSYRYGEVYFSFQHPYFLGYFIFWFFYFLLKEQYLGLSNFSLKGLIIGNFYKNLSDCTSNLFSVDGGELENKYRKQMYGYGMYFLNTIKLSTNFSNLLEKETNVIYSNDEHIITTFDDLMTNLNFLGRFNNLSNLDLLNFLDFQKLNFQLFKINWFNLDIPFPLNPSLIVNFSIRNNKQLNYQSIYHNFFLNYSHYDSLRENINFNLFLDTYIGTYFDSFNFISYYGTYGSQTTLPSHVLDRPDYLATHLLGFNFDGSKNMSHGIFLQEECYDNQDMLVGYGLMFQNLSFLGFFSTTLLVLLNYSLNINDYGVVQRFLEFYFKGFSFYSEFIQFKGKNISSEDKVFSPIIYPLSSVFSIYKQSFFLTHMLRHLPYDLLIVWFDVGFSSLSGKQIRKIFLTKKIILTNGFLNMKKFYTGIGHILFKLFIKK